MKIASRLDKLRTLFSENGIDAILISSATNRRYLSGFVGSAGYLLITENDQVLYTDFRYTEQAESQAPNFKTERISGPLAWFPEQINALGVNRVGFESNDMSVSTYSQFGRALSDYQGGTEVELIDIGEAIDKLRAVKDEDEIALITRAVEITDQAFEEVSAIVEPGMTEEQVSWELEKSMREQGAEGLAFETIVGAGVNGALPHHLADQTVIRDGQSVVIDMGAQFDGYCADLTRTIFVGEPDKKFQQVYGIVLDAQLQAEKRVRPGMTGEDIDAISRDIISEAGFGDNFGHSLGHGVGLDVHEYPRVGPRAKEIIEDGMVFTIEPGIYLTNWGGVRIEDIVIMENGHPKVISRAPKIKVAN